MDRNRTGRTAAARRASIPGVLPIILLVAAGAAALLLGHAAGFLPGWHEPAAAGADASIFYL